MNNVKNKTLIAIPFIIYIIIIPLYIYTYNNSLDRFWIVFIIERIFSFFYEDEFSNILDNAEEISDSDIYILLGMILFAVLGFSVLIYILFNYFRLFIILMIGELLDKIFDNVRNCLKKHKTINQI